MGGGATQSLFNRSAAQLGLYLFKVNNQLKYYQGRVWFTRTKSDKLKDLPMGRNTVSKVPHNIAALLGLANPSLYTFHSFRRTSDTSAADGSSTAAQMTDFFGWKNPSMCHEYVSSSKPAIAKMAQMLAAYLENFNMEDPEVETEVKVEVTEKSEKKPNEELSEDFMFVMEEDPEMYAVAGLPPPPLCPSPLVMARISKQRQNKASILTSFLISKRNEPSYSRTCQDRSEAYPAYSTPF